LRSSQCSEGALEPRLWRIFRTFALEYIAIAFAADFITLHADEFIKHPVSYVPFALMLVSGAGLRIVAFADRRLRPTHESHSLRFPDPSSVSQFGRMAREDHLVVWPVFIFVSVIMVLLVLDGALSVFFESALVLYGPPVVVLGAYALLKSAVRDIRIMRR